jgi:hypothetical protein
MPVRVEAVVRRPAGPMRVRVHSAVGTAVAPWRGAPEDVGGQHHVEWSVDEDLEWARNTQQATSVGPALWQEGSRVALRGLLELAEDGCALLEMGDARILFDLAAPSLPKRVGGTWVEVRVAQDSLPLWPCRL